MQSDGNFAVYNTDSLLWSAGTNATGTGDRYLKVQPDGNIVVYTSNGQALWSLWSNLGTNNKAYKLVMQNDGNLVAYDSNGSAIWSIGTHSMGIRTFCVTTEDNINSCRNQINGATNKGSTLSKGQTLSANQYLSSSNKKFIAKLQSNGDFTVYKRTGLSGTHVQADKASILKFNLMEI